MTLTLALGIVLLVFLLMWAMSPEEEVTREFDDV